MCKHFLYITVPIVVDELIDGSRGLRMHRSVDDHYPYQLQKRVQYKWKISLTYNFCPANLETFILQRASLFYNSYKIYFMIPKLVET